MRGVAGWIRGMRASSGSSIQSLDDDRVVAILFVGSTTEPGPGAALLATEPGPHHSLFVGHGTSIAEPEISGGITNAGVGRELL